jgi:hypothetical protein
MYGIFTYIWAIYGVNGGKPSDVYQLSYLNPMRNPNLAIVEDQQLAVIGTVTPWESIALPSGIS